MFDTKTSGTTPRWLEGFYVKRHLIDYIHIPLISQTWQQNVMNSFVALHLFAIHVLQYFKIYTHLDTL